MQITVEVGSTYTDLLQHQIIMMVILQYSNINNVHQLPYNVTDSSGNARGDKNNVTILRYYFMMVK